MDIKDFIKMGTYPRNYLKNTLPYSINPAIAFAMNQLDEPSEKDRILDPCCGTGTILIERQLIKPCICVGVDINSQNLEMAAENTKEANVSIEFKHGNIMEKKFPDNYFTHMISNLPFGIHSGSRDKNKGLYRFLADEAIKWLKPNGKAIFLTDSKALLRNAFAHNPSWVLIEEIPVNIRGLTPSIFIYQKISV